MKEFSKDEQSIIKNLGAFNYGSAKMSNILGIDKKEIENEMKLPESNFRKLYEQGRDYADFLIDKKLFDLAKDGDLKALEQFEDRKNERL
jgi:hypothetical protein